MHTPRSEDVNVDQKTEQELQSTAKRSLTVCSCIMGSRRQVCLSADDPLCSRPFAGIGVCQLSENGDVRGDGILSPTYPQEARSLWQDVQEAKDAIEEALTPLVRLRAVQLTEWMSWAGGATTNSGATATA